MPDEPKPQVLREIYPDAKALMDELKSLIGVESAQVRRERLQVDRKRLFAEISALPEKTDADREYLLILGGKAAS